jgi:hypothetical protein
MSEGGRRLLVGGLVLGAGTVVAVAAGGSSLLAPPAELGEGWGRVVRMAGATLLLAGVTGLLLHPTETPEGPERGPRRSSAAPILAIGTTMALLLALPLLGPRTGVDGGPALPIDGPTPRVSINPEAPELEDPPPPVSDTDETQGVAFEDSSGALDLDVPAPDGEAASGGPTLADPAPDRARGGIAAGLLLALLGGIIALAVLPLLRRRRAAVEKDRPPAERAERIEAGIEDSLREARWVGDDPRGRIRAAYGRLISELDDAGVGPFDYEAPHEHLGRVLEPLGVRPEPLHGLAALYVEAEFGESPMTEAQRERAADALQASLGDLRARVGTSPTGAGA